VAARPETRQLRRQEARRNDKAQRYDGAPPKHVERQRRNAFKAARMQMEELRKVLTTSGLCEAEKLAIVRGFAPLRHRGKGGKHRAKRAIGRGNSCTDWSGASGLQERMRRKVGGWARFYRAFGVTKNQQLGTGRARIREAHLALTGERLAIA
jgi:hypothetical protein